MYDPKVLLQTAFTLQSSLPEAHSSASERKYIWKIDQARRQNGWILAKVSRVYRTSKVKIHLQAIRGDGAFLPNRDDPLCPARKIF